MTGYLLDTHSFLWSVFTPERLSRAAQALLANAENPVYVSSVTFWEIALKAGIGKLTLTGCLPDTLPEIAEDIGYRLRHWRLRRPPASIACRASLTRTRSTGCSSGRRSSVGWS